jgi:hypothetical protein
MTVWLAVECPHCHSTEVVKHGNRQSVNNVTAVKILSVPTALLF